jgi:hypothetical protein
MWAMARETVLGRFLADPAVRAAAREAEAGILDGTRTPGQAVEELLRAYDKERGK